MTPLCSNRVARFECDDEVAAKKIEVKLFNLTASATHACAIRPYTPVTSWSSDLLALLPLPTRHRCSIPDPVPVEALQASCSNRVREWTAARFTGLAQLTGIHVMLQASRHALQ